MEQLQMLFLSHLHSLAAALQSAHHATMHLPDATHSPGYGNTLMRLMQQSDRAVVQTVKHNHIMQLKAVPQS